MGAFVRFLLVGRSGSAAGAGRFLVVATRAGVVGNCCGPGLWTILKQLFLAEIRKVHQVPL